MCKRIQSPARPQSLSVRFTPSFDEFPAMVAIGNGKTDCLYSIVSIPTDEPGEVAFKLTKLDDVTDEPAVYHVSHNGAWSQCECLGFLAHDHCKHVAAVRQLIADGHVKGPQAAQRICESFEEWAA